MLPFFIYYYHLPALGHFNDLSRDVVFFDQPFSERIVPGWCKKDQPATFAPAENAEELPFADGFFHLAFLAHNFYIPSATSFQGSDIRYDSIVISLAAQGSRCFEPFDIGLNFGIASTAD